MKRRAFIALGVSSFTAGCLDFNLFGEDSGGNLGLHVLGDSMR